MLLQLFNKLEQIEIRIKYLEEEKIVDNTINELILVTLTFENFYDQIKFFKVK